MKLYTNDNNTATLKVIIASTISGKQVELIKTNFDAPVFNGPRQLPLLEVNEDLLLFSSNAATLYFFPDGEESNKGQSQQLQEWEATRLSPSVAAVLSSKSPPGDLRQALKSQLQVIDGLLTTSPYVLGSTISAVDVIFFSTIYPLHNNEDLRKTYLDELKHLSRWYLQLAASKHVQSAVQQWGGCPTGPFAATSALGIPQNTNLGSPAGTPDESKVEGPSAEELSLARESWLHGHKNLPKPTPKPDVILPVKGRKNRLITSALPYVNNEPHLGNIIGCVLSADIFARYCRLCDYNTLFLCGTDEYGTATENKAVEEGLSPREICDKYHAVHAAAYRWFDAQFDYFGRTSTPQQTEISQKLFLKLHDNGFISSHTVEQLFCEQCERFLADRFVEGTCPHPGCNYDSARGDQCDLCGRLVVATELKDPKCKQCGNKPVLRDSTQLFLDLPLLEPSLRSWITSSWDGWSAAARGAARGWLREALHSRAITRDLRWGVPVPLKEYASKVFYVWFDAPIGYLSITQCATGDYEKWWKPEKGVDVSLYQFMAKDNVPFHALLFPAALIGANEGHLLVKHIYATEYLNYEEGKFSKSRGVGVFATDAKVSGIPADVWRFYLAAARPEAADCSFSWRELLTRNNSELLNNLGNFCHRALSFCATAFKGKVPAAVMEATDYEFIALVNREYAAYVDNMEKGKLRESLRHVLSIGRLGNQLMQAAQPWALLRGSGEDRTRAETCVSLCVNVACLLSLLLAPYTPEAAKRLKEQLNAPDLLLQPDSPTLVQFVPAGHPLGSPRPLFSRLDPAAVDRLRGKHAGSQADRAAKKSAPSIKDLELAIAVQADKVRQMKATTKDKAAWQPLVDVLLDLKKQLVEAQTKPKAGSVSVGELEKAVAEQADKVRQIKASTKDKAVIQPAVDKLLELKKQLAAAQSSQPTGNVGNGSSAAELEKAVTEQADKVRQIKASTKDKAVIQPAVDKLLALKKQLAAAQSNQPTPGNTTALSVAELEKAVAEQGDKVRQIKASTKDKAVIQPAVNKLLELKKQLSAAQSSQPTTGSITGLSVAELEKAIAEQADKVRQIKASTKDKAVIQPAVDKLLELKKQLATATSNQLSSGNDVKLSVAELEKAVAAQGDIVRQLKASTKDKAAWQPALAVLQDLKKKLAAAQ